MPCSAWTRHGVNVASVRRYFHLYSRSHANSQILKTITFGDGFLFFFFLTASALVRNSIDAMKEEGVEQVRGFATLRVPSGGLIGSLCLDRFGNRVRQPCSPFAVRVPRLYPRETSVPILPERQRRLPSHSFGSPR